MTRQADSDASKASSCINVSAVVTHFQGKIEGPALALLYQILYRPLPQEPHLLLIDSTGGCVHGTLGFVHESRRLQAKLDTRCVGHAFSCGIHLLQAATGIRSAFPAAEFWSHSPEIEETLSSVTVHNYAAAVENCMHMFLLLLTKTTKRPELSFWRDFYARPRYFDASEALSLGLIDEVF